jgi:hypothetical protein
MHFSYEDALALGELAGKVGKPPYALCSQHRSTSLP